MKNAEILFDKSQDGMNPIMLRHPIGGFLWVHSYQVFGERWIAFHSQIKNMLHCDEAAFQLCEAHPVQRAILTRLSASKSFLKEPDVYRHPLRHQRWLTDWDPLFETTCLFDQVVIVNDNWFPIDVTG